jgi:hypothetical protein
VLAAGAPSLGWLILEFEPSAPEVPLMAIAIRFDKAKAERLIDSLTNGKAIDATRDVDDVLALAGACFFMAMSQAPALLKAVNWERLGRKPNENEEDTFFADLHAAIEYYGQLTMLVAAGQYDEEFEGKHEAIVMMEKGNKTVIPLSGVREEEADE